MALDALDRLDDVEAAQASAASPPPTGGASLPPIGGFAPSDSLDNLDDVNVIVAQPVAGTLIGPVAVGYAPDANAAITVTPGTLDAQKNFTASGPATGPYAASVTLLNGVYSLTATATDPVALGAVSIQPGDYTAGVFTAAGPAIVGTLLADTPSVADVAWTLGTPQTSVFDLSSNSLLAGSDGFLHVLVSGLSNITGGAVDPTGNPVALAVTAGAASAADFQDADWLTVTAPPAAAGTYARLALSAAAGTALAAGNYRMTLQINGTTQLRVPGYVSVMPGVSGNLTPASAGNSSAGNLMGGISGGSV